MGSGVGTEEWARHERLDRGGSIAFYRASRAGRQAVLIEAAPYTWPPWADPAIFARALVDPHLVAMLGTELRSGAGPDRALIEWSPGLDLREATVQRPLDEDAALVVARDVVRALEALHSGFALEATGETITLSHGALAPRWIRIDRAGVARLAGAGLGVLKPEGSPARTREGLSLIPPERLGPPHDPELADDIFALGAALHWACTGLGLFEDRDELATIQRMRAGSRVNRARGAALREIVETLTGAVEARPTAAEARALIDEALASVDVEAARRELAACGQRG